MRRVEGWILALTVVGAVSLAVVTWAQEGAIDGAGPQAQLLRGGPGGHGMAKGHGLDGRFGEGAGQFRGGPELRRKLEGLGLSRAQRDRLANLRDEQMRRAIRGRADLRLAQLDLRKLLRSDEPDARAIDAQIERIQGLRTEMMKSRIHGFLSLRSTLTPEQRDKLRRGPGGPPEGDE